MLDGRSQRDALCDKVTLNIMLLPIKLLSFTQARQNALGSNDVIVAEMNQGAGLRGTPESGPAASLARSPRVGLRPVVQTYVYMLDPGSPQHRS